MYRAHETILCFTLFNNRWGTSHVRMRTAYYIQIKQFEILLPSLARKYERCGVVCVCVQFELNTVAQKLSCLFAVYWNYDYTKYTNFYAIQSGENAHFQQHTIQFQMPNGKKTPKEKKKAAKTKRKDDAQIARQIGINWRRGEKKSLTRIIWLTGTFSFYTHVGSLWLCHCFQKAVQRKWLWFLTVLANTAKITNWLSSK